MLNYNITDSEFDSFRGFIYDHAGIRLRGDKKSLITSRLSKRLHHYSLESFREYFEFVTATAQSVERQMAIDLLTTNETYFFREPKHFEFLEAEILPKWKGDRTFQVWSAASSSGEEAYSIAMLLDDVMGHRPWQVFGSDISNRVLKTARQGHYLQKRIEGIPKAYLQKYCLKGVGEQEGSLLINKALRNKVSFGKVNLKQPPADLGLFDLIFLRNVLIYFDTESKTQVIQRLVARMRPQAYLIIGHAESIKDTNSGLTAIIPTVYQKDSLL